MAKAKMPYERPGFKRCKACGEEKAEELFFPEPRVKSGRTARCAQCVNEANREYAKRNPEKIAASRARYAAKYPERIAAAKEYVNRRIKLERAEKRLAEGFPLLAPKVTDDGRLCSSCRRRKPKIDFPNNRGERDGLAAYCRECVNRKGREQAAKPKTQQYRKRYMRRFLYGKYGLTEEAFDAMLSGQNGRCAICESALELRTGGCSIDHNHTTDKVRGLLCRLCNVGLGHFKENPDLMLKAIAYIKKHDAANED